MLPIQKRVEARLDRPSMTGGGAALKARGYPPICFANRFPPRPLRGAALRAAALTAAPPPVSRTPFSMVRTKRKEVIMGMVQSIGTASDQIIATLMAGLEMELGRGAGAALADHFLDAEESDFLWDARIGERWLGSYEGPGEDDLELDRIAIWGRLDGRWFMAIMLVDGEGMPCATIARRICHGRDAARKAMVDAR